MVDSTQNEHNFWQFDPMLIGSDWAVGDGAQQRRSPKMKMSNFGALNYGGRFSFDYTRTDFEFDEKDEMQGADKQGMHSLTQDAEKNKNPLIAGSTVKYVRDDQFVRMGMAMGGKDALGLNDAPNTSIDQPKFDEMDTKISHGPWLANINYPTEGWHSFGKKYDGSRVYDGTLR